MVAMKLSSSCFRRLLPSDSSRDELSTWDEAPPVLEAPLATCQMLTATCEVRSEAI